MNNLIDSDKNDEEIIEEKLYLLDLINESEMKVNALKEKDWKTLLDIDLKEEENSMYPIENEIKKRDGYYTSTWPNLFTRETRYKMNKWMAERNIQPVFRYDFISWMTIYDIAFQDEIIEEIVKIRIVKYDSSGISFLNHVSQYIFGIVGAIFFLFLFGDIVTKEGYGKYGPIHFLKTMPIHRGKILISKLITILLVSMITLLIITIFSLLLGTVFDRFGDLDYPVLIYGENYTHQLIEMSSFLIQSVLLFLMVLLFCFSLLFLFSMLTKTILPALGLTIVTVYIGITFSENAIKSSFSSLNPFHYFTVPKIITNELAASINNFDFSFTRGLLVFFISSLILFSLTYLLDYFSIRHFKKNRL